MHEKNPKYLNDQFLPFLRIPPNEKYSAEENAEEKNDGFQNY